MPPAPTPPPGARCARAARRALRARSLALAIALASLAWGVAQSTPDAFPAFPLDRLVGGTEGYALTAVPGGEIARIDVTVLALQHDLGPGMPLVLVRVGGALIDEIGGVAAGMSGSPVYLPFEGGEALLGALAYVFPESDARLALVTPIEAMRSHMASESSAADAITAHAPRLEAIGAAPIATPVAVAGLGGRALALLDETVLARAPHALRSVQAGGGGSAAGQERDDVATDDVSTDDVAPGAAVAVHLVRGDVTVAVVGTVTEVDGDVMLGFGHPFLGVGPIAWPLTTADVTAIVPSRVVPFKLANVGGRLLGAVTQDRPAGIGARLGASPDVIPVTLTVATAGERVTLRFDVIADEELWPLLLAVATLEAIDRTWRRVGAGTADVAWEIDLPGGAPLRLTEVTTDPADLAPAAARLSAAPLAILAWNPFEAARPSAAQIVVTIDERRRDAEVVEVLVDGDVPAAGGGLGLVLRLQPWRRASEVKTFSGRLPAGLEGELELRVAGGHEPRDDDDARPEDVFLSYGELLTALRERPRGADLVIEVRNAQGPWHEVGRLSLPYAIRGVRTLWLDVAPAASDHEPSDGRSDGPSDGEENVARGDEP